MGNLLCCVDEKKYTSSHGKDSAEYKDIENQPRDISLQVRFENPSIQSSSASAQILAPIDQQARESYASKSHDKQGDQIEEELTGLSSMLPEDDLDNYVYFENPDAEIEEAANLRNEYEHDLKLSKRGIREFIDHSFDEESCPESAKFWELKLDKEDIKVYLKRGGSKRNSEQPYVKTVMTFNAAYSMRKVVEAIFGVNHRLQWDKGVLTLENSSPSSMFYLCYQQNKGVLNMNHRDFVDKMFRFSENGKFYIYYSSVPDDTQLYDIKPKTDRGKTILGFQRMERRRTDGKIVYQLYLQCDLKMKVTPKLIAMFLPSGMQDWSRKLQKYLITHYDSI